MIINRVKSSNRYLIILLSIYFVLRFNCNIKASGEIFRGTGIDTNNTIQNNMLDTNYRNNPPYLSSPVQDIRLDIEEKSEIKDRSVELQDGYVIPIKEENSNFKVSEVIIVEGNRLLEVNNTENIYEYYLKNTSVMETDNDRIYSNENEVSLSTTSEVNIDNNQIVVVIFLGLVLILIKMTLLKNR